MRVAIKEGGNVQLKGKTAQKIDLKVVNRSVVVGKLKELFKAINVAFNKKYKTPLWDPKVLDSYEFFSGSSLHLFNLSGIDDETFTEKKPLVGDIDTMVDVEKKDQLTAFLDENEDKQIGPAVFIGSKGSGAQSVTLWEFIDPPFAVQVDFEYVKYKNKLPTEWSKFSHSSSWDDIEQGIKGVFHKYLIQALTATSEFEYWSERLNKPVSDRLYTFAIGSSEGGGLRVKYDPVIDPKTKKPKKVNGYPVVTLRPTTGYEQDLDKIFSALFHTKFTPAQIKKLRPKYWSFTGLIDMMNMFLDTDQKKRVIARFLEKTISPQAQGLYRDDPDRDMAEKSFAINKLYDDLKIKKPVSVEIAQAEYKKNYKMAKDIDQSRQAAAQRRAGKTKVTENKPTYKRKGVPHIYNPGSSTELKDREFIRLCQEIAKNNGTLDGVKINLKADGSGVKFGKDENGQPFVMKKDGDPIYKRDLSRFTDLADPTRIDIAKLHEQSMRIILDSNFISILPDDTIVSAELLFTPMGRETEQGVVFIRIPYDPSKLGKAMTLVVYAVNQYSTGELLSNADEVVSNLEKQSTPDVKIVSNRLEQEGINLSSIIKPVLTLKSTELDTPEAKKILAKARKKMSDAIIDSPKLKNKDKLGEIIEGIVINFPGNITAKVTSDFMKNVMARQKGSAPKREGPMKTAVVAIGGFAGHKGHQQLWDNTVNKAEQLGGDPYLFIGSNVSANDPIPPDVKVATWHRLYPEYASNISTINVAGGTLIKKIKHELINPTPGKPPKYDNIIIMVGEDKKDINFPEVLMKSVRKFPGYEHVNVSLEATPRETGIRFTDLRNALKDPNMTPEQKYDFWAERFNEKKLGKDWIKNLMNLSARGMNMNEKLKEFYLSIKPLIPNATIEQKAKLVKLLESAKKMADAEKRKDPESMSGFDDLYAIDPESRVTLDYAKQHYPLAQTKGEAFVKFVQRSLKHSKRDAEETALKFEEIEKRLDKLEKLVKKLDLRKTDIVENGDYTVEK